MLTAEVDVAAGVVAAIAAGFRMDSPDPVGRAVLADWYAERGHLALERRERLAARALAARVTFGPLLAEVRRPAARRGRYDMLATNVAAAAPGGSGLFTDSRVLFRMRPRDRARVAGLADEAAAGRGRAIGPSLLARLLANAGARPTFLVGPDPVAARWAGYHENVLGVELRGGEIMDGPTVSAKYWRFLAGYFPKAEWRWGGGTHPVSLHDGREVVALVMPLA